MMVLGVFGGMLGNEETILRDCCRGMVASVQFSS